MGRWFYEKMKKKPPKNVYKKKKKFKRKSEDDKQNVFWEKCVTYLVRNGIDLNENIVKDSNEQINEENISDQQIGRHD